MSTPSPLRIFALLLLLAPALVVAQTPSNIEAAEYDPSVNRWFISNGSSILETYDGGATYGFFGSGSATHGMEVIDGALFVLSNNSLRAYDLESGDQLGTLSISGASFLNGMGSRSGELVVSDFSAGRLHRIDISDPSDMSSTVLVFSTGTTPNGVVIDETNNRAVIVNWGSNASISAVDLTSAEMTTLVANTGLGNLDGVDIDADGNFYVSSWSPARITRYTNDFSESETVASGTVDGLSSPADISYSIETDTLGVANSGNDTPSFHYFGPADVTENNASPHSPLARWDGANIIVNGAVNGTWTLTGYSLDGKLLGTEQFDLPAGEVRLPRSRLSTGIQGAWLWSIESPTGTSIGLKPGPRL
jgi:hypothetical protein